MLKIFEYYRDYVKINFTERLSNPLTSNKSELSSLYACPLTSRIHVQKCFNGFGCCGSGGFYGNGSHAETIHNLFLSQPKYFTESSSKRFIKIGQRISINMFAGKMSYIKNVFRTFLDEYCCDDEGFVGKWPSHSRHYHVIDTDFTIVHFAFNLQKQDVDMSQIFDRYKQISMLYGKSLASG
jgi:hypothetical protein